METSKEKFDQAMKKINSSKLSEIPNNSEVDEVEKHATALREEPRLHISSEEKTLLTQLFKSHAENKITDPVLLHLLKMRETSKVAYVEKQSAIKSIYMEVMKELNGLSQEALKLQGALESVDRQIIEFLKSQQAGGDPPPAA